MLWFVPASDDASFQNIPKSLSAPVPAETAKRYKQAVTCYAWGTRPGPANDRKMETMSAGDICLFYTQATGKRKAFYWAGIVRDQMRSSAASSDLWGSPAFEHVYWLSEVWPIELSLEQYAESTGYQPEAPKGIFPANADAIVRVMASFKTVETWARSLVAGRNPEATPVSPKSELPIDTLIERISASGFHFAPTTIRAFHASLQSKPFVILAGNSGTGKSRLVRLYADCFGATEQNRGFQMIPVRPDWNDGSELVGYTDLENKFRPGKLVEPILRAHANPEQAFFVCLDEMNLARVEHYFSDFLSIIESRRKEPSGSIVTDAFLRREQIATLAEELLPEDLVAFVQKLKSEKQDLGLPPNLFIVGTVNMDETTQPFSRKVLDRANTLELNSVDLRQGFEPASASDAGVTKLTLKDVAPRFVRLLDLLPEHRATAERAVALLEKANSRLAAGGFEVGYRVRDEAAIFLVHAKEAGLPDDEAADCVVMQKILPRIHGSSPRLEKVLESLLTDRLGADAPRKESDDFVAELQTRRADSKLTPVARKLAGMWLLFREENYTSFWLA